MDRKTGCRSGYHRWAILNAVVAASTEIALEHTGGLRVSVDVVRSAERKICLGLVDGIEHQVAVLMPNHIELSFVAANGDPVTNVRFRHPFRSGP